jgi:1-acyl-sn-glycerol-3-phosphate acyltransferase
LLITGGAIVWTFLIASAAVIGTLVLRSGRVADRLAPLWARWLVRMCGIRLDLDGREHLQPGRSYVIISNHLSHLDIVCTFAALPTTIRFVAKHELLRVPVFGRALRLSDHIIIDRQDPLSAIRAINAGVARTPQGVCLVFYAEGTRSPDGRIHAFKKGGVSVALQTQLPILPLTISGTYEMLPKGALRIRPGGRVRIVLAPAIETAGRSLADRDQLNDRVRDLIVRNYVSTDASCLAPHA